MRSQLFFLFVFGQIQLFFCYFLMMNCKLEALKDKHLIEVEKLLLLIDQDKVPVVFPNVPDAFPLSVCFILLGLILTFYPWGGGGGGGGGDGDCVVSVACFKEIPDLKCIRLEEALIESSETLCDVISLESSVFKVVIESNILDFLNAFVS